MTPQQQRYFTFSQIAAMIAAFGFGMVVHYLFFCPAYCASWTCGVPLP